MISKSRIDRAKFQVAFIPKGMDFFGNFLLLQSSSMRKSGSDIHQDFALSAFNDQVRIDFWKKCIKGFTSKLTIVNSTLFFGYACFSLLLIISTAKFITNPIHNTFIGVRNLNVSVVIKNWIGSKFRFAMKKSNKKTAFSIDKSCEICNFCISHKIPLLMIEQYAINPNICTA